MVSFKTIEHRLVELLLLKPNWRSHDWICYYKIGNVITKISLNHVMTHKSDKNKFVACQTVSIRPRVPGFDILCSEAWLRLYNLFGNLVPAYKAVVKDLKGPVFDSLRTRLMEYGAISLNLFCWQRTRCNIIQYADSVIDYILILISNPQYDSPTYNLVS